MNDIDFGKPLWHHRTERFFYGLVDMIKFLPGGVMVEVGSFFGESAILFAKKYKKVYAVDLWEPWEDKTDGSASFNLKYAEKVFNENTSSTPNIIKVKKSSISASNDFEDASLDFVYIDANHTYKSVKEDILAWRPKVKPQGYIGGHDYIHENCHPDNKHMVFLGIKQAVDEIFGIPDNLFSDQSWIKKL